MSKYAEELLAESRKTEVLSANYTKAVSLTRRIKANALAAQESLWELCKGLKEMHDSKLYKELGYSSFEKYTEDEVGIKRHQAQKYIAIADMENGDTYHHLGLSKLALLAKLDEPQREEIQQTVNVEDVSVRELKKEIARLQNSNAILQGNITDELNKSAQLQSTIKSLTKEKTDYQERQDKLLRKNRELVSDLERTEKERVDLFDKLERAEGERDRLEEDLDEAKDTVHSLEKQLEDLESRPVEVAVETKKSPDIESAFKAYMEAAVDSMKRLTEFCEENINSPERQLFVAKLSTIVALTNRTVEKLKGA